MRVINVEPGKMIILGKRGENEVEIVRFNVTRWQEMYGEGGNFVLLAERNGDEAPYIVPIAIEDGIITWTITNADTSVAGFGRCELQYYVGETVSKSITWTTRVIDALGDAGEAPEAYSAWVDEVLAAAQAVTSAKDLVESCAESATQSATASANSADRAEAALIGIQEAIEEVSESGTTILPLTEQLFLEIAQSVIGSE